METTIKKYLEGRASREEMIGLVAWLDKEENQISFKETKSEWKARRDGQSVSCYTLFELDKFKSKLLNEHSGRIRRLNLAQNFYKYAALLLLFISIGGLYFYISKSGGGPAVYNTVMAENGQVSKALLPDSTMVWLNSGSSLTYSNRFGIENRNMELSGQAYFDVSENKALPFVVSCGEIKVKVLGTQFTAETYHDNLEVSIILIEGAVELTASSSNKTFAGLQPNEMMVYNKQNNTFKITEVVAEKYTSWRDGIIHIYDQPLKDAVTKLQKRYNQKIIVEKGLEDYKVTFSVRNENFNEVMDVLLAITPAKAYQEGEIIYLKKKQ